MSTKTISAEKTHKRLLYAYLFTAFLILLMVLGGSLQVSTDYDRFGWSYEQITIINGVESHSTVYIGSSIVALFFLLWLCYLLLRASITIITLKSEQISV